MGYTKLFSEIIMSTVWREKDKTRLVWITMLALRNRHHVVEGSVPGLADCARVSIEACRTALKVLSEPDPDSRSQEQEGRRIQKVDGGWFIINGEYYRRKMSEDERREKNAIYQKNHRERKKSVSTQSDISAKSAQTEEETDADAEPKTKKKPPNPLKGECDGFDLFWSEYPNKQAKLVAKRAWLKIKPDERADVMSGIARWKRSESWLKDDGQFIPHPATFLNQRRFEDSPKPKALKKKIYYNHLPPKNDMPDSDFVAVRDVARKEMARFQEKFK